MSAKFSSSFSLPAAVVSTNRTTSATSCGSPPPCTRRRRPRSSSRSGLDGAALERTALLTRGWNIFSGRNFSILFRKPGSLPVREGSRSMHELIFAEIVCIAEVFPPRSSTALGTQPSDSSQLGDRKGLLSGYGELMLAWNFTNQSQHLSWW